MSVHNCTDLKEEGKLKSIFIWKTPEVLILKYWENFVVYLLYYKLYKIFHKMAFDSRQYHVFPFNALTTCILASLVLIHVQCVSHTIITIKIFMMYPEMVLLAFGSIQRGFVIISHHNLSYVTTKLVYAICKQQRHRSACTSAQSIVWKLEIHPKIF